MGLKPGRERLRGTTLDHEVAAVTARRGSESGETSGNGKGRLLVRSLASDGKQCC